MFTQRLCTSRIRHHLASVLLIFAMLAVLVPSASAQDAKQPAVEPVAAFVSTSTVFFNEIHYDNAGEDFGEVIEIAGPAGTDLTGWSIVLYNGSNGTVYDTISLNSTITDQLDGYGVAAFTPGSIQNGGPDGFALVDDTNTLIEFLSYEGAFTGVGGAADGIMSTDIGVAETSSTPIGESLQRTGSGTTGDAFVWTGPAVWSVGSPNTGQDFSGVAPLPDVFISEFHYDNTGGDSGEFVELTGPAGTDLVDWSIVLYNGSNGTVYNTVDLSGITIDDEDGVSGAVSIPITGLQNGSPDGIALVGSDGSLVEFLSYEGSFAAVGGAADGVTSVDVVVSEPSDTAIGDSLQLIDGVWTGPAANSAGSLNAVPQPFISEIHYDNAGADVGEFIEISGPANFDLAGWKVLLYNGSDGSVYATLSIAEAFLDDEDGTSGTLELNPAVGLQNGSPDGIALIDPDDGVVEFLSYEGSITATSGAAVGLTSVDIGVEETSTTPVGQSVQLVDGVWIGPVAASPGMLNTAVVEPPALVFIHGVQGSGSTSPLEGQAVTISGIVVGDFQAITTNDPSDAPLDGFFVQEEDADSDADPLTSEGIFVYDPAGMAVAVGDLVTVSGNVTEFFGLTEINAVTDITIVSSGNTLPTPAAPTVPTTVGAPAVDWEAIEGMSVLFSQPLYVTGTFPLGRYGEVQLSAIGAQDHPNQTNAVGSPDSAAQRELNLDSRVILDDGEDESESFPAGIPTWNPDPTPYLGGPDNTLRSGDVVNSLAGVVHYAWNEYEVHPVNLLDETDPDGAVDITRTPRPAAAPDVGGSLQVASFNVLNYFTTLDAGPDICGPSGTLGCRGANTAAEFDIQSAKIATAIAGLDADVVGLIEIENSGTGAPLVDLVTKVNALSARTYDYVDTGFIGTDAIAVAYIYDIATVEPQGDFALLDSSVSPAFIDDKNRPVLAQTWLEFETDATLTTAVGHLKSKGSSCDGVSNPGDAAFGVAPYGAGVDVDDPNFQGNCNLTRAAAAQVLGQWLANDPTGSPSDNLLILGDLNAYANEDPVTALNALGYVDLHAAGGTSWASGGHSYVFDGEHGTLDYALGNTALIDQVTGAKAWHINADEPFAIDYQDFNPPGQAQLDAFKSSDHDPTIVGLNLTPAVPLCNGQPATIVGTEGPDELFGTSGPDVIVSLGGIDIVYGYGGDDVICLGEGDDFAYGATGMDQIFGEGGRDTINGGSQNDMIDGGDERDRLRGGRGNDLIFGGAGNDRLFGNADNDTLDGGEGNDFGNGGGGAFDSCVSIEVERKCEVVPALAD